MLRHAHNRVNNLPKRVISRCYVGRDGWGEILDGKLQKNAEYEANLAAMNKIVAEFVKSTSDAMMGGGAKAVAKHKARGKLLPLQTRGDSKNGCS
jgi:hypothetical protein